MAMVATREVAIQTIVDANAVKAKRKNAYLAEVANNLFVGLERALKPNAPLLLNKFKQAYPQAGAYAKNTTTASAPGTRWKQWAGPTLSSRARPHRTTRSS